MITDADQCSSEALLAHLNARTAGDWATVAQILAVLEARSRVGPDGRPWLEIVGERLEAVGQRKSAGHLRKMRRAYAYLQSEVPNLPSEPDAQALERVFLTSLEFAERISGLDRDAGRNALIACLEGAPPAKLQALYEAAQIAHADQRSARQLAWETRRKIPRPTEEALLHEFRLEEDLKTGAGTWWDLPEARIRTFSPGSLRPYLKAAGTGVTVTTNDGRRVLGGFRLQTCSGWNAQEWQRLLESTLFHASFFDRYWLAIDASEKDAETFWSRLVELSAPNIGLIRTDFARPAPPVRIGLAQAAPAPDRRGIVVNALLQRH